MNIFKGKSHRSRANRAILRKVWKGNYKPEPSDDYYYVIKMTNELIAEMDDKSIQRFLCDVDNRDLSMALKGLSRNSRKRIHDGLSKKFEFLIAQDTHYMGKVELSEVGEAVTKLLRTIARLIDAKEIVSNKKEIVPEMVDLFTVLNDPSEEASLRTKNSEDKLYKLWEEYLVHSHKMLS